MLPVFKIKQAGTLADNENSLVAVEPDVSTTLQPVSQADRKDLTAPSLAEVVKAQAANVFCQAAAKELGKAGTEITVNKKRVLVQRALVAGALQRLSLQSLQPQTLALSH